MPTRIGIQPSFFANSFALEKAKLLRLAETRPDSYHVYYQDYHFMMRRSTEVLRLSHDELRSSYHMVLKR